MPRDNGKTVSQPYDDPNHLQQTSSAGQCRYQDAVGIRTGKMLMYLVLVKSCGYFPYDL